MAPPTGSETAFESLVDVVAIDDRGQRLRSERALPVAARRRLARAPCAAHAAQLTAFTLKTQ